MNVKLHQIIAMDFVLPVVLKYNRQGRSLSSCQWVYFSAAAENKSVNKVRDYYIY